MTTSSWSLPSFPREVIHTMDLVNKKNTFPERSTFTYVSKPLVKRLGPGNHRVIVYSGSALPGRLRSLRGNGHTLANSDNHYSGDLEIEWDG